MYRARYITVGSLVSLFATLCAAVALAPTFFALYATDSAPSEIAPATAQDGKNRSEVGRAQLLISVLAPIFSASTTPSDSIEHVLSLKPKGVTVHRVVYSGAPSKEIVLMGDASDRSSVYAYQQALRADSRYKNVVVPINDLTGTKEGGFSMTITGGF